MAGGEAVERSLDFGGQPQGRLTGDTSGKFGSLLTAGTSRSAALGKPMPELESMLLFSSTRNISLSLFSGVKRDRGRERRTWGDARVERGRRWERIRKGKGEMLRDI